MGVTSSEEWPPPRVLQLDLAPGLPLHLARLQPTGCPSAHAASSPSGPVPAYVLPGSSGAGHAQLAHWASASSCAASIYSAWSDPFVPPSLPFQAAVQGGPAGPVPSLWLALSRP